ncbi:hypothetical protein SNE40_020818 [Patella caerulea]|uniref:Uncharacterized protein n=1 Tax=Patella caerulea TaxID=87958 RepID=A0AAN8PBT3_PATCE
MVVSLPFEKSKKLICSCQNLLVYTKPKIRMVAQVIGLMVSSLPAISNGEIYYRILEIEKINALKVAEGDYEQTMCLSKQARQDLLWWCANLEASSRSLVELLPSVTLQTDASLLGWGAVLRDVSTGGRWNEVESKHHINYLELKAALFGLQALCVDVHNEHVRIEMDNTTAVAYVNSKGGSKSPLCNSIAREISLWCIEHNITLSASHIPGVSNHSADRESRVFDDKTEWALNKSLFNELSDIFGHPDIDMFASRLNKQINKYVAWKPDPQAFAIDAFSIPWSNFT